MLVGSESSANTFPYIDSKNCSSVIEHEASTSKMSADEIFYLKSRGLNDEQAISLLLNGFCKEVFNQLPLEFSVEAVKLLELKLEKSIG
jgi:Fe-S cluster assembly protein SufB